MPAFTHICSTLSISLAHNVITLYPNSEEDIVHVNSVLTGPSLIQAFNDIRGSYQFVYRFEPGHSYYHDDNFMLERWHSHLKFPFKLDEDKIIKVLTILCSHKLINSDECFSFLKAYRQALRDSEEVLTHALSKIELKIEKLEKKAQDSPDAFTIPLNTAKCVYNNISERFFTYKSDKSLGNYNMLTYTCDQEIRKAREALQNYNGWKPASVESEACSSSSTVSFFKPNKKLNALEEAKRQLLRI